jgi:hypothetical protein
MAKSYKIDLKKIKEYFLNKNIKIKSIQNFSSDASNKEFKLCASVDNKYLLLSFKNQPSDFKRYINATNALIKIGIKVPKIIYTLPSNVIVIMQYLPNNNAVKYLQSKNIDSILLQASNYLWKIKKTRVRIKSIRVKSKKALITSAFWGINTYVDNYKNKINQYELIIKLIQKVLKKNLKNLSSFNPILAHGDYFLDNLIYHEKKVWVIDHQDLIYDHPYLDIASLVFDSRRIYKKNTVDKVLNNFLKKHPKKNRNNVLNSIHLVSLARNLRVLGAWVLLHRLGKTKYLKSYRKQTWHQISLHLDHLKLYELRDLLGIVYKKTT